MSGEASGDPLDYARRALHAGAERVLRAAPAFPLRPRFVGLWLRTRDRGSVRLKELKYGGSILCDFATPYEAMVWLGEEEAAELDALAALLRPGDTFVDCGANVGLWTIAAANLVGAAGSVYAVEANPRTVETLRENLRRSRVENVCVVPYAAGEAPSTAMLDTSSFANLARIQAAGETVVDVRPLDAVLDGVGVDGIKVDVEGYEPAVLRGATGTLQRCAPWVVLEFNPAFAPSPVLADWEAHQFLRSLGYRVFRLFGGRTVDGTREPIDARRFRPAGYENVLYLPAERRS